MLKTKVLLQINKGISCLTKSLWQTGRQAGLAAAILETKEPELPNEMQELLKKKRLTSTTDLILKKYKK